MQKIFKLLLLLMVAGSPLIAGAIEWKPLGTSKDSEYFFDPTSISGPNNARLLSVKRNATQGPLSPTSFLSNYQVDCASNEYMFLSGTTYKGLDFQGAEESTKTSMTNKVQQISPNTVAALFAKAACANQNALNNKLNP